MPEELGPSNVDELLPKGPQSALERRFIKEYLQDKGFQLEDLKRLPLNESKQLMTEACRYASLKLAEVESKAKFRKEIRGPSSS
ncbi:hypothetical protein ACFLY4_06550 [Chloroflexota bacterium]